MSIRLRKPLLIFNLSSKNAYANNLHTILSQQQLKLIMKKQNYNFLNIKINRATVEPQKRRKPPKPL